MSHCSRFFLEGSDTQRDEEEGKANQGHPLQMDSHLTAAFFQQWKQAVLLGWAQSLPHGWDLLGSLNRAKSQPGLLRGDNALTKNSALNFPTSREYSL